MSDFPTIPGYRVLSLLGSGSFADVFLAEDVSVERRVAIKLLREQTPSLAQLDRFRRERETLASLSHPHVLRVHAAGSVRGRPYVVTELLQGKTLEDLLRAKPDRELLLDLVHQAALGVAALHEAGLVHRDVKPENLLLDEGGLIKVADLGLVGGEDLRSLTVEGALIGTPAYMAPEMCVGQSTREPACDVYSLGATLYEVLTGELPHPAPTIPALLLMRLASPNPDPRSIVPELPSALAAVCMRAMEKSPQDRYANAGDFAEDLVVARSRMDERETSLFPFMVILAGLIALVVVIGLRKDQPSAATPSPRSASLQSPLAAATPAGSAIDIEVLRAELLERGGPESIVRAQKWIAANPGRVEAGARLRDAVRAGVLGQGATRSQAFPLRNLKHRPTPHPIAEGVLWVELCDEYCPREHSTSSRILLIKPDESLEDLRSWKGHHVTAFDEKGRFWAARSDGGEDFLYQRFGLEFDYVAQLPGRCTAIASRGNEVVCGLEDGRVLKPQLREGQSTWEEQVHRGRVVRLCWTEARLISLANAPRPFVALSQESGQELAPQFQLPSLAELRWGQLLKRPEEFVLCAEGVNVVHGVRPDGESLRYVGRERLNSGRLTGQAQPWSPDGTTPRAVARLGGLLISVGSQRFEKQRDSQLRLFERRSGEEILARLDRRLDYCSLAVQSKPTRVLVAGCVGTTKTARLKVWELPAWLEDDR